MNRKKGFTLIEMLIYMGLVAAFLVILSSLFTAILETQLDTQSRSALDQGGQYLLNRLSYDIRRADSVTVPASIGNTGQQLTLMIDGVAYSYFLANQKVQLTVGSSTYTITPFDLLISGFTVVRRGNSSGKPVIDISLSLTSLTTSLSEQPQIKDLNTSFQIR
jgi:type II secretory pathway pseudopilin PulG